MIRSLRSSLRHLSLLCGLLAFCSGLRLSMAAQAPATPSQTTASPQTPASPGGLQSRDLHTVHPAEPGGAVSIPHSYALVIGISHYKNLAPRFQLQYPDRDAADMYTTLISPDGGQFPPANVHRLLNSEATVANIRRELEQWLPSVTKPDDRVLIYFAGHGFVVNGKAYLAPYDVSGSNIAGTALPMDELGKDIGSEIKGKWKVMITDACHSGAITPEAGAQLNQSLLNFNNSLFSLTASRDREQSFEGADWGGGHGVFTYYVIQGLRGAADTNNDGIVTADELAEYVRTNVRRATNGLQNPTSERGSFDPNMLLAYNPGDRVHNAAAPPLHEGQLIVVGDRDNTAVWLDGKEVGTVDKGKSLRLPGLAPGEHTIKGVHMGYQPDGPRAEQVYPGQDTTVNLHIYLARQRNQAAMDLLDKGIQNYQKGSEDNYKKAADLIQQSIALDGNYSPAYVYLGRVENALFDNDRAAVALQKAVALDPDNPDAHTSYAGVLLETGNLDEAARQLDDATRFAPNNGVAWYLLSQAYARQGNFGQCKWAADHAVQLTPANGEAHLWLADCDRHLHVFPDAESEYNRYLQLSRFDSGAGGNLNYYVLGSLIGFGQKHRAAQHDIWQELQAQADYGLCECEAQQGHVAAAVPLCQKALTYQPDDLFGNFRLGVLYVQESNQAASPALLAQAKARFQQVIATNPDADEAAMARKYITRIDTALLATATPKQ